MLRGRPPQAGIASPSLLLVWSPAAGAGSCRQAGGHCLAPHIMHLPCRFFLLWSLSSALTPLCRPHPGVSVEHAKVCRASQLFPEKEPWPAWDFGERRLCAGAAFPHLWCGTFPARAPFPDFGKSRGSCPGWAGGLHRSSPAPAPPASALLCGDRQLPNLSLGWFNFNPQNEF